MKPLVLRFVFQRPYDELLSHIETALEGAGLRVECTFDLRLALVNSARWSYPEHDKPSGRHEYTVLLVYGAYEKPATVVVHGDGCRTWAEIINNPQQKPNAGLQATISQTLGRLAMNSQAESTEEHPCI